MSNYYVTIVSAVSGPVISKLSTSREELFPLLPPYTNMGLLQVATSLRMR